jgi:2-polyprenyl-6-hydroxyphenyl methylase/3-demethylubiquinone-9 3-methyltransferase
MIPLSLKWKIAQFFEIRWWRNYLSEKSKDEYLAWKRNYWQQFLKRAGVLLNADKPLKI